MPYSEIPKSYKELIGILLPRKIHDKVSYENALELIDVLAGHHLNKDQEDYLDILSDLVAEYEEEQEYTFKKKIHGLEALKYLLEENGLNATDLAKILDVDRTIGSRILTGERSLTVAHIKKLSDHFKVSADLFLE